jgi:hypothetical protein
VPNRPTKAKQVLVLYTLHALSQRPSNAFVSIVTATAPVDGLLIPVFAKANCASGGDGLEGNGSLRESVDWKDFVNKPKPLVSANLTPVTRQLAESLNSYRNSIGSPSSAVMFQLGGGDPMGVEILAKMITRSA